jgi:hypothetical protein
MVSQQRSRPRLDGCVRFDADSVRVGDARVACHVEQGGVVVVLGDRLRPLTVGERALAVGLGAGGLARVVWQLSAGYAAPSRSAEEQAVVEAVALYLAGAANTASLHLSLVVAARYLGDPARAQVLGATIADDLAARLPSGAADPAETGWTVLRVSEDGEAGEPDDAGAELHDPVGVREALVAALLDRAELPVPPELADAAPMAPPPPAVASSDPAPLGPDAPAPIADQGAYGAVAPVRLLSGAGRGSESSAGPALAAAVALSAAPVEALEPVRPATAQSRFPAWSAPASQAEPVRGAAGSRGADWGFTASPAPLRPVARPRSGTGWGEVVAEPRPRAPLSGIDWQTLPTIGRRSASPPAPDGGRGSAWATEGTEAAWPERTIGAHEGADGALGLSTGLAEQLLAAADRRGLA